MVSFENFVKSMPPSLSELKVIPSFCFAFKIPDDVIATIIYKSDPIFTWYWRIGFRSDQKWGRYFSMRVISQFGDGLFQLRRVEVEVECRRYRQWFVRGGLFLDRGGRGRRGGPGGFHWAPASPAGSVGSCCHLSSGVPRRWRWLLTENNNYYLDYVKNHSP